MLCAASLAYAAGCPAPRGGRILLASEAVDPDVFLWDSRDRLLNYSAGQWRDTRAIFAHTLLAEPGTQALVMTCVPGAVHSASLAGDANAMGVKVLSGRYRGRYGWVLSSDTHLWRNTAVRGSTLKRMKKTARITIQR